VIHARLLNGHIIGIWDFEEPSVKIFLFRNAQEKTLREIHAEVKRIRAFISGKEVKTKECHSMVP